MNHIRNQDGKLTGISYAEVVPWGRSYEDYLQMFLLSEADLNKTIIGVADGPASFNAGMKKHGKKMVSVDPIYQFTEKQIRGKIDETFKEVILQTTKNQHKFNWDKIKTIDELGHVRMSAMREFCDDFEQGKKEGRYLEGSLPSLPFPDQAFDLVLSSHLLFFYSENKDLDFHLASIKELTRIGKEVRIFPLVDVDNNPSKYLPSALDLIKKLGYQHMIRKVPYHFQKNGNEMLTIFCG